MRFQNIVTGLRVNIIGILIGSVLSPALFLAILMPSQATRLIFLAVLALIIMLQLKDLKKPLLIAFVVDIALGLDVALANRGKHLGGPAGFLVSLMTIALIVGYLRWLIIKPVNSKIHIRNRIAVPAIIFLLFTLLSVFQAADPWFTFTQFFLTLQFVLMYFYLINNVTTWSDIKLIISTLAISVILESILMLMQYYGGLQFSILSVDVNNVTTRATGTFSGPNPAASFLSPSIAIIFAAYLTDNRLINNKLAVVAMIGGVVALMLTRSRTGWLGLLLVLLIIAWSALRNRLASKKVRSLLGIVLIIGLVFSPLITDRLTTDDNNSAESRLWYNDLALNVIKERMFTGIGANNQQLLWENDDYLPLELVGTPEREIHNTYLATWVELGLFGFLAFIWMLFAALWQAFSTLLRTKNRYGSIVVTGFLSALVYFMIHMSVATFIGRRPEFIWLTFALITVTCTLANTTDMDGLERIE